MSKRAFFFGLLVAALLVFSLYRAKYGAKDTAAELMAVEAQIEAAEKEKALLETELAHMSRRDFIEEYARKELGMAHLIRGTRREFQKLGRMVTDGEFGEYYALVH